jgi:hypothetical protein
MFVPFSFFSTQLPPVPKPTGSYSFDSSSLLSWPSSTTGYTLYTGGFASFDDNATTSPILSVSNFIINNQASTNQIYVSTNGYITFGAGSGQTASGPIITGNAGASIAGNPGDMWLEPGLVNDDGDTQNLYYTTGSEGDKSYIKFIVYSGIYGSETIPSSYLLNLYIDTTSQ